MSRTLIALAVMMEVSSGVACSIILTSILLGWRKEGSLGDELTIT